MFKRALFVPPRGSRSLLQLKRRPRHYQQQRHQSGNAYAWNDMPPMKTVNPQRQYATAGLAAAGLVGGFLLLDWFINRPVRQLEIKQVEPSSMTTTSNNTTEDVGIIPYETLSMSTGSTALGELKAIPKSVHEYMFNTYKYVAGGIGLTAASAYGFYRTGVAHRLLRLNPMVSMFGLLGLSMGAMIGTRMVDPQNTLLKHGMFTAWNITQGLFLCTMGFYRPQILIKAGLYTAGIFGATTFTAMTARHDAFLWLGAPLFSALIIMIIASFGRMLLPARFSTAHNLIEGFVIYGGLMLFCGFLLYDTQVLMKRAHSYDMMRASVAMDANLLRSSRLHPQQREEITQALDRFSLADQQRAKEALVSGARSDKEFPPPDHINESIGIYLDLINIFVRLVVILGNQQKKKR